MLGGVLVGLLVLSIVPSTSMAASEECTDTACAYVDWDVETVGCQDSACAEGRHWSPIELGGNGLLEVNGALEDTCSFSVSNDCDTESREFPAGDCHLATAETEALTDQIFGTSGASASEWGGGGCQTTADLPGIGVIVPEPEGIQNAPEPKG